jgi:prevent-host-death family protein
MKSLPVPVAKARSNFSDVLDDARKGRRIRLTRHGKAVGWIIGEAERQQLDASGVPAKSSGTKGVSKAPKSRRRAPTGRG